MKKLIWGAALALCLMLKTDFLLAQDEQQPLHGISAKVLFIDYYTPNSVGDFKMSNGLELAYLRSVHPNINLALPLKIGIANLAEEDGKATFFSLDAVAQYQFAKPESRILPYVFAGLGIVFEKLEGSNAQNTQVPLGLGVFYRVGGSSFFTAQAEYRKSFSDLRDNLQFGIGWHFKLKPVTQTEEVIADADADGLPDAQDHCPNEAGTLQANGCPDADGDGIANGEDDCPVEKGL
ncbi:MAG: outer membrane beta-barrel protein, partial [Bacteroidota bacterium]